MIVTLNLKGRIVLLIVVLLTLTSVLLRIPPLILIAALVTSYLIAYPLLMIRVETPFVEMNVRLRHNVVFRAEVEVLHIKIMNKGAEVMPLLELSIQLPVPVFTVNKPLLYRFTLEPNSEKILNIPIIGAVRGLFDIGPIQLKVTDPFNIFEDIIAEVESVPIKIYPKRLGSQISKSRAKKIFSKLIGFFSMTMRGLGTDFHGLREYIRGDPSKIVDWKATARASKLISKEFEDEKKLEVLIAVDSGSTTRGSKYDYLLGMAMDVYNGFVSENKPVGFLLFDDDIRVEFLPSPSPKRMMQIWASIYSVMPNDVYSDYLTLDKWVDKNGITNTLIIILGDFEGEYTEISNATRNMQLRNNYVMFLDIWGFSFGFAQQIEDSLEFMGGDIYGTILEDVIGWGIKQNSLFRGLRLRQEISRFGVIYGYIKGPEENIVNALDRAMYSHFGDKWRAMG